jgi:invasion protein IalB
MRKVVIALAAGLIASSICALPASAQQAQQNVERTQSGDWSVECVQNPQAGRLCRMVQNVKDPKNGNSLMEVVVAKPPNQSGVILSLRAPLGVWLRPGLTFGIDGGKANSVNFEFCLQGGCLAQIQLSAGKVNAMKRGSKALIGMQNIRRQKLNLTVSLRGFTAAYGKL